MKLYVIRHGQTKSNEENKYNCMLDENIYNEYYNYYSSNIVEGLETLPELFNRVHTFLDEIKEYEF